MGLRDSLGRKKDRKSGLSHQQKAKQRSRRKPHLYDASWGDFTLSNAAGPVVATSHTITSTGSQTYTVPRFVDTLTIELVGGGGGGGKRGKAASASGGGGGSGGKVVKTIRDLKPGTVLTFNVGAGGDAGTHASSSGGRSTDGGDTTLTHGGVTYTAGGGNGGNGGNDTSGPMDSSGGVGAVSGGTATTQNGNNGVAATSNGTGNKGLSIASTGTYGAGGYGGSVAVGAMSANPTAGSDGYVRIT